MSNRNYVPPTFDHIIEEAKDVTLEQGYYFPTVLVIGTSNTFPVIASTLGDDHEERKLVMERLGYMAPRVPHGRIQRAVFIMESWMLNLSADDEVTMMPSLDPRRIEALHFDHYIVRTGRHEMVAEQMLRDAHGELYGFSTVFDTRLMPGADGAESPLMDAFMRGYVNARKGKMPPPPTGARG